MAVGIVVAFAACLSSSLLLYQYTLRRSNDYDKESSTKRPQGYVIYNQVTHARLLPVKSSHAFTYPTLALFLSLDALEAHSLDLAGGYLFGYGGIWGRLLGLRSKPYLSARDPHRTIRQKLEELLRDRYYLRQDETFEDGWILTMPSICGWEGINPLTTHFLYKAGELWLLVFEIHNTFGESHVHLLEIGKGEDAKPDRGYDHQWTVLREFHVSPFSDRSGFYQISIKSPSHPPTPSNDDKPQSPPPSPPRPAVRVHLHTEMPSASASPSIGPLKLTALLRSTTAVPLTSASLLTALAWAPLGLFLTMARIEYHAYILHYAKKLDVFLRPDPLPPATLAALADPSAEEESGDAGNENSALAHLGRAAGGVKWIAPGPLETSLQNRLLAHLRRRVRETGVSVTLIAADPAVSRVEILSTTTTTSSSGSEFRTGNRTGPHLRIYYLTPRFFTLLFMAPSPAHALVLGCLSEKVFYVSERALFVELLSLSPSPAQAARVALSRGQLARIGCMPVRFLNGWNDTSEDGEGGGLHRISLPVPLSHPLDGDDDGDDNRRGSSLAFFSFKSLLVRLLPLYPRTKVDSILFTDGVERRVLGAFRARWVGGTEPWFREMWERAGDVVEVRLRAGAWAGVEEQGGREDVEGCRDTMDLLFGKKIEDEDEVVPLWLQEMRRKVVDGSMLHEAVA